MYFVYALADPRTSVPGYVGITNNPRIRYSNHLVMLDGNTEKNSWIQRLKNANAKPILEILETVSNKQQALQREQYWIDFYLRSGINLTNVSGTSNVHQFFKRLDDEWEKYKREVVLPCDPTNKQEFIDRLQWFIAGDLMIRFPSKRGIILLWKEQQMRKYE